MASLFSNIWLIFIIVLFFGASIFIHELGHFLAARKRGLKVLRFSIGFGPKIFGWTRDGIEYRLSLLPLGGYVALPQLVDMGRVEGSKENQEPLPPISLTDKVIVTIMGPIFNVLFALFLACILWFVGQKVHSYEETQIVGHVSEEIINSEGRKIIGPAQAAGIQIGDKILEVDGKPIQNWMDLRNHIILGSGSEGDLRTTNLKVERIKDNESSTLNFTLYPELITREKFRDIGIYPALTVLVGDLMEDMPGIQAGLKKGDKILLLNGNPVTSIKYFVDHLQKFDEKEIQLQVERNGSPIDIAITPVKKTLENGVERVLVGFQIDTEKITVHKNPFVQISSMIQRIVQTIGALFHHQSDIKLSHMGGFIGITHASYEIAKDDFYKLIWFMTFININLAILNLLPIPVLDGGHLMFALIEKLRGKAVSPRVLEKSLSFCAMLLITMILYVSYNDIKRVFYQYFQSQSQVIESVNEEQKSKDFKNSQE